MSTYEAQARAWAKAHPTRDNGTSWSQWCGAQTYQFACQGQGVVYPSATAAYNACAAAGLIKSTDWTKAGIGAIHYWTGGTANYGHVAQDVRGAGSYIFMASTRVSEVVGTGLGFTTMAAYNSQVSFTYRGWSYHYGVNATRSSDDKGTMGGGSAGIDYSWGLTQDAMYDLQEAGAKNGRYSGAVDGAFGPASVKMMQQWLKDLGYLSSSYDVDGVPGATYGKALQNLAAEKGSPKYTGPIDGYPGSATSTSLSGWAKTTWYEEIDYGYGLTATAQYELQRAMAANGYYSGPEDGEFGAASVSGMQTWLKKLGYLPDSYTVDGVPGPTYGTALQELARDKGVPKYTGPIDGEPGEATSAALAGWAVTTWDSGTEPDVPTVPALPTGQVFAVDVNTSQPTFDWAEFKAGGGDLAIAKMGGANAADSPYVSPYYTRQISAARKAGMTRIGHYWFNGRRNGVTPTTGAEYFVANLHDFQAGDVLILDIEDDGTDRPRYTPSEALEFANRVEELTGQKILLYMNASDEKTDGWADVVAAGHGLWVASWGSNNGELPSSIPDPAVWADWVAWQFTSARVVPGWSAGVDCSTVKESAWKKYGWSGVWPTEPPEPDPCDADEVDCEEYPDCEQCQEPEPGDGECCTDLATLMAQYLEEERKLARRYRDLFDEYAESEEVDA